MDEKIVWTPDLVFWNSQSSESDKLMSGTKLRIFRYEHVKSVI